MKFKHKDFECEVDKYEKDKDIIIRLYEKKKEQKKSIFSKLFDKIGKK